MNVDVLRDLHLVDGVLQDEIFVGCFNPDANAAQP